MNRLAGRVIAITREGSPDDPLARALEAEGARVVVWPTLAFDPPSDPQAVVQALDRLERGGYDWVVVTSARAADALAGAWKSQRGARVAAVGPATARAIERLGGRVDVTGDGDAAALVAAMAVEADLSGAVVLFPAASRAGDALEDGLGRLGARVERVEAYRTRLLPPDPNRVRSDLANGVDVVTFASPSAVASVASALGRDWPALLGGIGVAAIGSSTQRSLVEWGIPAEEVTKADRPGIEGLVDACVECIERKERNG